MDFRALDNLRARVRSLFIERHIFVRTHHHVRGFVITSGQQLIAAAVAGVVVLGAVGATVAAGHVAIAAMHHRRAAERQVVAAERQTTAAESLAERVEARQTALAHLLAGSTPTDSGAVAQLVASPPNAGRDPLTRIAAVGAAESRAVEAADALARLRAEQLRRVLQAAGIDPARMQPAEGGPLIRPGDPIARLAASDEAFFEKAARAANSLSSARRLAETVHALPLGRPVALASETSGFGFRADPFTGEAAFHAGQDFAAPMYTPVSATGGGRVSFAGQRSGYGNTVEIDHGHGLMTRYGHLAAIHAFPDEPVAAGQVIGALGSTGRSTGPHLHYEIWLNGSAENPMRFVHAGDQIVAR